MDRTRRVRFLMDSEEYERLEEMARGRRVSVADLIRSALREKCLLPEERRRIAAERICSMNLPVGDWTEARGCRCRGAWRRTPLRGVRFCWP